MKSNVIILHGCPSDEEKALNPETRTYDKHWIPWTRNWLMGLGFEVETPMMPEPWKPNYEAYKNIFDQLTVNENTILIGHSCGSAFLVRWLGETKRSVAKLILVAPWKIPDTGDVDRVAFYTYPIDPTISLRVGEIVLFTSDNEEEDGKRSVKMFHDVLGGRLIELKDHGHFTMNDMGTEEFPELIEVVVKKNP